MKLTENKKLIIAFTAGFLSEVLITILFNIFLQLIFPTHTQLGIIFIKPSEIPQIAGSIQYVVCS
jgi:hypothetical protein